MKITIVDNSEYLIISLSCLFFVGILISAVNADTFDIIIYVIGILSGFILTWRVRKLGKAHTIMESAKVLKVVNVDLTNSVITLNEQNETLIVKINDMSKLMCIFDKNNKTAEEIQDDMINTLKKIEKENQKYESLNKCHAFIISDINHDGELSELNENEQTILKSVMSQKRFGEGR